MPDQVVHFEIPADDPPKLAAFYGKLFGWTFERMGPGVEYWNVDTGGRVNGGIMRRVGPNRGPINYVKVADMEERCREIVRRGGKVIHQKQPVPGLGYFAIAEDPEGNPFGVWQDDPEAVPTV